MARTLIPVIYAEYKIEPSKVKIFAIDVKLQKIMIKNKTEINSSIDVQALSQRQSKNKMQINGVILS